MIDFFSEVVSIGVEIGKVGAFILNVAISELRRSLFR